MPTRSTNRASEVLEALAREPTRRPLYKRSSAQEASIYGPPQKVAVHQSNGSDSSAEELLQEPVRVLRSHSREGTGKPRLMEDQLIQPRLLQHRILQQLQHWLAQVEGRKLAASLGVIALVALGLGWTSLRRPASVEDRLPIASSASAAQPDASGASREPAAGSGAGQGNAAGVIASAKSANAGPVFVHVAGAVLSAGVVQLPAGSRVVDAVAAAGGLRPEADSNRVNLAATLLDGSQVLIPAVGQPNPAQVPVVQGGAAATASAVGSLTAAVAGPVNLNTATLEQLDSLPGVGPATAQAILSFRDKAGKFDSVEALVDVRGIGDAKFEALRELVTV